MKLRFFFGLIVVPLLCGCTGAKTSLKILNHSGSEVSVTSGQTGAVLAIPRGGSGTLPHTLGSLEIKAADERIWRYPEVSVPDHPGITQRIKTIGGWQLYLELILMTNGTLVATGAPELIIAPQLPAVNTAASQSQ